MFLLKKKRNLLIPWIFWTESNVHLNKNTILTNRNNTSSTYEFILAGKLSACSSGKYYHYELDMGDLKESFDKMVDYLNSKLNIKIKIFGYTKSLTVLYLRSDVKHMTGLVTVTCTFSNMNKNGDEYMVHIKIMNVKKYVTFGSIQNIQTEPSMENVNTLKSNLNVIQEEVGD